MNTIDLCTLTVLSAEASLVWLLKQLSLYSFAIILASVFEI